MSDYLWDRSGPVDQVVADFEGRLRSEAFDPADHPLPMPAPMPVRRPPRWRPVAVTASAIAAVLVAAVSVWGFHVWRLRWDAGRAWSVNGGGASTLPQGGALIVGPRPARIDIARLGVLTARPGTELGLTATSSVRHRLTLTKGEIDVRVWAPPGRVAVHTPAGDVIDLGCIFQLSVDDAGVAHLAVDTGWVNLQNAWGDSYVPAGASADMRAGSEPQIPVYDDAAASFKAAVRAVEASPASPAAHLLRDVAVEARPRDALTLLMLSAVSGLDPASRTVVLERLAIVNPPSRAETVTRTLAGDRDAFWTWYDELPLPSLKNWWANWRDVFPR